MSKDHAKKLVYYSSTPMTELMSSKRQEVYLQPVYSCLDLYYNLSISWTYEAWNQKVTVVSKKIKSNILERLYKMNSYNKTL
jgi:hypothetical protein